MSKQQEPLDSFSIDTDKDGLIEAANSAMRVAQETYASRVSVHDNFVYAYVVHCDGREIILHTEYLDTGPPKYTDVIFSGVIAHHFELSRENNILFDIEEDWPHTALRQWPDLFEMGKGYRWPIEYSTDEELLNKLAEMGIKSYSINSTWGLFGWVWASEMKVKRRDSRKQIGYS